jgi:phenolic acid decarboxylase
LPCGDIKKLSNSQNWKQVIGKDPTTGLWGFKIDDIPSFGKDSKTSFTVKVTVCSDSTCLEKLGVVAYKAGQCIDYDTLEYEVTGGGNGGGDGDGDSDGDDVGNGDGDGDGGGDNGGGNDSTQTCSTLSAMLKVLNAKCYGYSTGSLEVVIENGQAPFLYRWSTGSTDSVLQNLTAGVYSVTVTDANGNTLTLNKEVAQPADILISESIFNPSCSGNANGSINLAVSGGAGGYAYFWSNGATTKDLTSLSAGLYTVTVTDSSGCSRQKSIMLTNASRVSLSGSVTKTSCGQTNGALNITVSGGITPYTYVWDNGATTEDIQNLAAGTYKIRVTDAAGCTAQSTYTVSENNTVRVNFTVTPAGCFNEPIGAIDITPSGGTSPYTYTWQHGPASEDLTGLVSGIYRVTVTDQSGCSVLTAINVPKKSIPVTTEIIQPLCSGDSTGSITVTPIDGGATYT